MSEQDRLLVTNIQRCCFHDGPGIRTTVFLKGCALRCPWCSNPENINPYIEQYIHNNHKGTYGRYYTAEELYEVLVRDEKYYLSGGGVTFSGGEPLMQSKVLKSVMELLRGAGIHIGIETSLFADSKSLNELIDYVDIMIVDIKILDAEKCKKIIDGDINVFFDNIRIIEKRKCTVMFRIPCCKELTYNPDNIAMICEFLKSYPDSLVQIFSVHSLGNSKYQSLGRLIPNCGEVGQEDLEDVCNKFIKDGIRAEIIGL